MPALTSSYAVAYSPDVTFVAPTIERLKANNVQFIRITWLDLLNNTRFRILPINYFEKLVATGRPGISIAKVALGLVGLTVPPGFSPTGEYLYVIDFSSLRICFYAPGHASVFGWFQEKNPSPNLTSLSVDLCPRTILSRLVAEGRSLGLSFLTGIETEFILLKCTDPITAVDVHDWSTSAALRSGSVQLKILEDVARALEVAGIELQMIHAEAAPGQFEVVTGPLPPLEAADALIFTRETIANIANKYGLHTTLAPRVFDNTCGSGAHTHVSIHSSADEGHSSPLAPTLKPVEASFLQGLLDNVQAITAFSLPTAASYARMVDGAWAGGTYVCWGTENREAPIRLCGPPGSHNFELKCVDGTSNPYLLLAAVVAAGIDGVRNKKQLRVGDCLEIAADIGVNGRSKLGIDENRMPLKIEEAREHLKNSEVMRRYLGDNFIGKYITVNETLQAHLSAETPELEMNKIINLY